MEKKVRSICYVLRSFPEPSETFIAEEAQSVLRRGVRVSIVVMCKGSTAVVHPSSQKLIEEGLVWYIGQPSRWAIAESLARLLIRSPLVSLTAFFKALRAPDRWRYFSLLPAAEWCKSRSVEYLHAHFADVNLQAAEALSQWLNQPFGVTTHRYDIVDDPMDPTETQRLLNASRLLVTISEWNVRHMAEKYSLAPQRLNIVRCGVDLSVFAFRERSFSSEGPFRLLNVARLMPVKGQAVLLKAVSIARDRGITCRLDIIGAGPLELDLRRLCSDLRLDSIVRFHGAQPQSFVRKMLADAHAFVLSSTSEGLPVACLEAAASGVPLICTRINGIPELIDDRIDGLLVEPEDPFGMADAIVWAATHRETLALMAASARGKVEAAFERGRCTDQLLALVADSAEVRR